MVQGSWVGLFVLTASLSGHGLLGRMFLFQDLQLNGLWWFGSFFRDGITASTPPLLPARPYLPPPWFEGPGICAIGSQSVAVKLLFSFFGDLPSTPPFSFCVADSKATQASGSQLVPSPGRQKDIPSKVRPFILEEGTRYSLRGIKGISKPVGSLNLPWVNFLNFSKTCKR